MVETQGHLSAEGRKDAIKQESDNPFLLCLTVEHEKLLQALRVVANTEDIVRQSGTYSAFPFEIRLPDEDPDRAPRTTITIDNVDGTEEGEPTMGEIVESFVEPATMTLEAILAKSPDVVEFGPIKMELGDCTYDEMTVQGSLTADGGLSEEPYPGDTYNPVDYPALHKR